MAICMSVASITSLLETSLDELATRGVGFAVVVLESINVYIVGVMSYRECILL